MKEQLKPEQDGLFVINGTRTLYYQDEKWFKPIFRRGGVYTGNISQAPVEPQPRIIRSLDKINTLLHG